MFRKSRDIFLIITGFIFQIFMMKVNMKPTSIKHATRIELAYSAWEADVLPLNYACACLLYQNMKFFPIQRIMFSC